MYGLSNGENIFDLGWPLKVRFQISVEMYCFACKIRVLFYFYFQGVINRAFSKDEGSDDDEFDFNGDEEDEDTGHIQGLKVEIQFFHILIRFHWHGMSSCQLSCHVRSCQVWFIIIIIWSMKSIYHIIGLIKREFLKMEASLWPNGRSQNVAEGWLSI